MASSSSLKKNSQKPAAFVAALVVHLVWLFVLARVTPYAPPPLYTPPIDISLLPFPEIPQPRTAGAAGGGSTQGQGGLLRRLETGPVVPARQPAAAQAAPEALRRLDAPTETAVAPPTPQTATVAAAARPAATPSLRPAQTLAVEPEPTETVRAEAPSRPQQTTPVTALARPTTAPSLRPAQALAVESEPTETVRAQAPPRPQQPAPVTAAAKPSGPASLRPAQTLAVESEPTETVRAGGPPRPQQAATVTAAARPGPAPQLAPARGLAAAAAPAPPSEAPGSRAQAAGPPASASGPATPRPGPGAGTGPPQAFAGAGAAQLPGPGTGCEPEVLMLLTPAEKERCRNQVDAARARIANRNAAAEAARRVQEARRLPGLSNIPLEKRAYYDAVQAAKAQVRGDFRAADALGGDRGPTSVATNRDLSGSNTNIAASVGVRCGLTFGVNKGKPAKPRFGLSLGAFVCPAGPPAGFLTEEARISPP